MIKNAHTQKTGEKKYKKEKETKRGTT